MFHKIADVLHAVAGVEPAREHTVALIAAGGCSVRMEGGSKQMALLCGKPLIVHTLLAFERADCISSIIVAAKEDECPLYGALAAEYGITKFRKAVIGGESRQESVKKAFAAIPKDTKFVAIADGARCLVTPEDIDKVCHAAYSHGAATAAFPVTDTVKVADKNGYIASTPDRATLWAAQTPQVFKVSLYQIALYHAEAKKITVTDDNSLAEAIKASIKLVKTSHKNLKITYPSDLLYAEAVLREREAEQGKEETR